MKSWQSVFILGIVLIGAAVAQDAAAKGEEGEGSPKKAAVREEDLTIGGEKIPPELLDKLKRAYAQKALQEAEQKKSEGDQAKPQETVQEEEEEEIGQEKPSFQWAHPDVSTSVVFPDHLSREFIAGNEIDLMASLHNGATKPFTVFAILASLYHPLNDRYFIQNFTARRLEVVVPPGEEVSLSYKFTPDPSLEAQTYKLLSLIFYTDQADNFTSLLFNDTIKFLETPADIDFGTFVIFVVLLVTGIIGYFTWKFYPSIKKRIPFAPSSSKKGQKEESFTQSWLSGTAAEKELKARHRATAGKK